MVAEPGESYHFDIERDLDYGREQLRTAPAYDCAFFATHGGWVKSLVPTFQGGAVSSAGMRNGGGDTWTEAQFATVHATGGLGVAGGSEDPKWNRFLVAHDARGNVKSTMELVPEDHPISIESSGRFWCLMGPAPFEGGAFTVTPDYVDAQGLSWSEEFQRGFMVRIIATADTKAWHLVGPDGSTAPPAGLMQNRTVDLQFCSPTAGRWELRLDSLSAGALSGWEHMVAIFDIDPSAVECAPGWHEAPIDRLEE